MTGQEHRRAMWLIREATSGNPDACDPLVRLVDGAYWRPMIGEFRCIDPAYDRDDLRSWFREGIWKAIRVVDGRGDPVFHLAKRGRWKVCSTLALIHRQRQGGEAWVAEHGEGVSLGMIPEGFDLPDERPEADPAYAILVQETQNEARQSVIKVLASASLRDRDHDVIDWLMTDPDPFELGSNQRLARKIHVSEQRASKLRSRVMEALAEHA